MLYTRACVSIYDEVVGANLGGRCTLVEVICFVPFSTKVALGSQSTPLTLLCKSTTYVYVIYAQISISILE